MANIHPVMHLFLTASDSGHSGALGLPRQGSKREAENDVSRLERSDQARV